MVRFEGVEDKRGKRMRVREGVIYIGGFLGGLGLYWDFLEV